MEMFVQLVTSFELALYWLYYFFLDEVEFFGNSFT